MSPVFETDPLIDGAGVVELRAICEFIILKLKVKLAVTLEIVSLLVDMPATQSQV
jgi:hypothetical protein